MLRTFRCSAQVRTALHPASVGTTAIEDEINGLDEGGSLQIPVNAEQFTAFYRKAAAESDEGIGGKPHTMFS